MCQTESGLKLIHHERLLLLQMIMGAGKTSVVSPMLALMLADGRSLVLQVCPKNLLQQTRQASVSR